MLCIYYFIYNKINLNLIHRGIILSGNNIDEKEVCEYKIPLLLQRCYDRNFNTILIYLLNQITVKTLTTNVLRQSVLAGALGSKAATKFQTLIFLKPKKTKLCTI